ncbi:sodium/proline symporter PutP, partial [Campylobacter coli]|nr:sodium/proline symporter PutP [Campylobacter coli]
METVQINTPIAIMFVAYAALMLYIGFYFYRQNKNTEDYFLGGRSLGPVVSALSAGASDMSGWLLMGLPGALYASGLIESYIAVGLSIGALLNWSFVAKRLRIYTSVIANSITIPDYFETRFDDDKHILRIVCAIVILIFFTFYVSSGLVGGAKLFEATFGIRYEYALTTGTLIIVAYTFLGGYKAVCWTDLLQGLLMMGALIVVPAVMLYHLGGFGEAMAVIEEIKPNALSMGEGIGALSIVSALAWGLGYFGQPHILVRFMSIRSTKDIPAATFVGISWMVISLIGACFIGLLGIAYVHKFELTLQDPEKIFIVMSQLLFNPWIAGILLSAILAAIMSTASSQLLVSSSTIAEDFYKR